MGKNLILSISKLYSYDKIKLFIETLRKTDGDIVLFVCEMDKETRRKLKEQRVTLIDYENHAPGYQIHYPEDYNITLKNLDISLMSYRFLLYKEYLEKNEGKYNFVFMADLDVVFQKNQFDFNKKEVLYVFAEDGSIGGSRTEIWLRNAYGKDFIRKFRKESCFCCGTTMGSVKEIKRYLQKLCARINDGNDQAVHNYLIYTGKIKKIKKLKNGAICLTAGPKTKFRIEDQNKICNMDGEKINFVYQWQKNKVIGEIFGEPKRVQKAIRKIKGVEFARRPLQAIKECLYSTPFFGKRIRKYYINKIR